MENMQFEDQNFQPRYQNVPQSQKGMVGWLIKKGIVKDQAIANYILLGVAVLFVILTITVFFIFLKKPAVPDASTITDPSLDPALLPGSEI